MALVLAAAACTRDAPTASSISRRAVEATDLHLVDSVKLLDLATYDGSNQPAHPDFVSPSAPWPRQRRYLVVTPFANGLHTFENPSIFESVDAQRWWAHSKTPHPLVQPTSGYLSDPDIVYDPDRNQLMLYYRQVTNDNVIHLITSADGRQWSAPAEVLRAPNHRIVSPSVVRRSATEWWMWSVNAGDDGCASAGTYVERRRSSDGISWSKPDSIAMSVDGILTPWHIDVQWIPSRGEYWAVFNAKSGGGCSTKSIFFATSKDGLRWTTYPNPVIVAGVIAEFSDIVYRSTFSYSAETDVVTFWYSGAAAGRTGNVWRTAVQKRNRETLFFQLALPRVRSLGSLASIGYMGIDPPDP